MLSVADVLPVAGVLLVIVSLGLSLLKSLQQVVPLVVVVLLHKLRAVHVAAFVLAVMLVVRLVIGEASCGLLDVGRAVQEVDALLALSFVGLGKLSLLEELPVVVRVMAWVRTFVKEVVVLSLINALEVRTVLLALAW